MTDQDPIPPPGPSWEPRVAVLEQIARDTVQDLADLRQEVRLGFERLDRRIDTLDRRHHTDFLWLLGVMLAGYAGLLGVMAHGFKWI